MKNVALYCRVSTERQMNEKTVDSQVSELLSYCKKNHFLIFDKYIDDGYSGSMLARPSLDRLRDDAKAKKFEAVLLHAVDRLSRNHIHAGIVIEELQKSGIEIIFLNAPPTDTPEGRLQFDIQSVVAQYEKEKIKERTRRGRMFKARSGLIVGNIPPFGYRYVKHEGVGIYEVNKDEATVVREIFDLYVGKALSIKGIAKTLYLKGVKAPKGGSKWGSSTVSRVLTNESYTGITHYHKNLSYEPVATKDNEYRRVKNTGRKLRPKEEWIPIKVPVIIERVLYDRVQIKKKNNSLLSNRNTKHTYLLGNLIEHSPCGYKMGGGMSHGIGFYRCTERLRSFPAPKTCSGTVKSDYLDELIWSTLANVINHPRPLFSYLKSKRGGFTEKISKLEGEIEEIKKSLERIAFKEEGLSSEYSEGVLNTEQVATLMNGLNSRKRLLTDKQLEKQVELTMLNNSSQATPTDIKGVFKKLVKHIATASFEKKRAIVRLIVDKIRLEKQRVVLNLNLESPEHFPLPNKEDERGVVEFLTSVCCGLLLPRSPVPVSRYPVP